ncbi:AI-2E family transporter [Lysobacter korlensis]|uniref:AI-2E family transporter n=1 Tax=Lysobacter korlensis TaxID=553636 RepID=A0ABV6RN77_9GAMM
MRALDHARPNPSGVFADRLGRLGIRSGLILLVVLLAAAIVWGLVQLKLIVVPLLIALILAAAIGPMVNWMVRRGVPATLATWIAFLGGLLLLGGTGVLLTMAIRAQWDRLVGAFDEGVEELQALLLEGPIPITSEQIAAARESVADFLASSQFGSGALAGVSIAIQAFTGILLVLVILFFLLKDGGRIWEFLLRPLQGERLERGRRIGRTGLAVLGGYARGTALVALVDAVAIGVALAILQVPLAVPLAVVMFLAGFVPVVGPTIGGGVAAIVALVANGPTVALIVAIVVFVIVQLEQNLLRPIVMGQSVNLHPLAIIVALVAGAAVAGIAGAILAVPVVATAWAAVKAWNEPASPPQRRAAADAEIRT